MPNARSVAVDALMKVEKASAYSNITINNALKQAELSSADKAFASALFYGVLDRKLTLDYILNRFTKTPFEKVDSYTANVLREALFQIMFMDRVPNSAAVNEAVKLMKNSRQKNKSGFVNAVLRSALREENLLPKTNSVSDLSVRYSCPEWIINELLEDYGEEITVKFLEESLKTAPIHLKINTIKISASDFCKEMSESKVSCSIEENGSSALLCGGMEIENSRFYKDGLFHVQDLSSQKAVKMLNPLDKERILDMCASPGGKSFTLAELMNDSGEIISCDLYESRVRLIKKGAERLGLSSVKPMVADASVFIEELGKFDAVLCDVPCSGLGIIRRKPDIKYKPACDFEKLQQIQQAILNNAVNYLKTNGRILYSTCTVRKEENEKQIERFLINHTDFELKEMHTFLPHIDSTDGFFAAVLVRRA